MKKFIFLLLFFLVLGSLNAQNNKKMKIAVMDFRAGVGVNQSEVEGLSDMLINTLYESKKFYIVERSQLNQVLKEQRFQSSDLSYEKIAKVGRILGVKAVLVGTVNYIDREYNVDIRAVNVESAMAMATAGATKTTGTTYRQTMEKIGRQLVENLEDEPDDEPTVVFVEEPSSNVYGGIMRRKGRDLLLDDRELSSEEVRDLVGLDNYETYLSARKQITTGRVFTPIFYGSLGTSVLWVLVSVATDESEYLLPAGIFANIALISGPFMIINNSAGKGRMNWVADEYNHSHSSVSYTVSPSVLKLNMPQSQGNSALGMTVSVNF